MIKLYFIILLEMLYSCALDSGYKEPEYSSCLQGDNFKEWRSVLYKL